MKTEIPFLRHALLALLICTMASCLLVPFVSKETLAGLTATVESAAKIFFFSYMGLLALFCFSGTGALLQARHSRHECRKAFLALHRHFRENSLEGFRDRECRRLRQNLHAELRRHCLQYPWEQSHPDIQWYLRYSEEITGLRSFA